jgi:O-antigen/teichoic acid export membrane protein
MTKQAARAQISLTDVHEDASVVDYPRGLRSLAADSVVYGASIAALPAALILSTPVVARMLGTGGFGAIDVLSGLVALASIGAMLGMDAAVARSWFEISDERRRSDVVRTAVTTVAVSSAVVAVPGFALFALAAGHVAAAALAFGAMPLINAQAIARTRFLLSRRRPLYLAAALLQALVGVGLAVVLVALGAGSTGYFLGLALGAASALVFTVAAAGLRRRGSWLDRHELPRLLSFGLPLVPAAAAVWAVFAVDRTLVAALRSFHEAGLYGVGAKVTAPMMLLASAFSIAWGPFILGQPDERRAELRGRALTAVVAGAAAFLVVLVLFAPQLVEVLGGPKFEGAERAVPGVAFGWLAWAAAAVLATEFSVRRRTWPIAVATGAAALANVVLNLILIPPFGYVAAAWVTAASFTLLVAIYILWERSFEQTPYRYGRLVLVALLVGGAMLALLTPSLLVRIPVAVVAAAALAAVAASDRELAPAN